MDLDIKSVEPVFDALSTELGMSLDEAINFARIGSQLAFKEDLSSKIKSFGKVLEDESKLEGFLLALISLAVGKVGMETL